MVEDMTAGEAIYGIADMAYALVVRSTAVHRDMRTDCEDPVTGVQLVVGIGGTLDVAVIEGARASPRDAAAQSDS